MTPIFQTLLLNVMYHDEWENINFPKYFIITRFELFYFAIDGPDTILFKPIFPDFFLIKAFKLED